LALQSNLPQIKILRQGLENIISFIPQTEGGMTTLSNGEAYTFYLIVEPLSGAICLSPIDWTVYVGSISRYNTNLPDGVDVTMSQWLVVPFVYDYDYTDSINVVAKIYVKNISAGSNVNVYLQFQSRAIQNSLTTGGS